MSALVIVIMSAIVFYYTPHYIGKLFIIAAMTYLLIGVRRRNYE